MTDSKPAQAPPARGKRQRLIDSACELLHRQGVASTTLAQVAEAAQVPPGNVYYYFKTKDDLVRAVLDSRVGEVRRMISAFEAEPTPGARLKGFVHQWAEMRDLITRQGCPIGTLCAELGKREDGLDGMDGKTAVLMETILAWLAEQFRLAGQAKPRDCAIALFGGVQGAALIANTLRDPDVLAGHVQYLEQWIETLV